VGVDSCSKLKGFGEVLGCRILSEITGLDASQAVDMEGITVDITIFLEEVFDPT
jgi:hypothetical protein